MIQAITAVVASLMGGALLAVAVIAALGGVLWLIVLCGVLSIVCLGLAFQMGLTHPWTRGER